MKVDEETILWIKTNTTSRCFVVASYIFVLSLKIPHPPYIRSFTGQTHRRWLHITLRQHSFPPARFMFLWPFSWPWSPCFPSTSRSCVLLLLTNFFSIQQFDDILQQFVFPFIPRFSSGPSSSNPSFHNSLWHSVLKHPYYMPSPF